jgi:hypothetical protein
VTALLQEKSYKLLLLRRNGLHSRPLWVALLSGMFGNHVNVVALLNEVQLQSLKSHEWSSLLERALLVAWTKNASRIIETRIGWAAMPVLRTAQHLGSS